MINTQEQVRLNVEIKKQIVYLNGEDVGTFWLHDESKIGGVLGPNQGDPQFTAWDVPQAVRFILGHALFGMEYFDTEEFRNTW